MKILNKDEISGDTMKTSVADAESLFTVVKRNGQIAPFRIARIERAIEAALRDTKGIEKESNLPEDIAEIVHSMTTLVVEKLIELAEKGVSLSVEGIQDIVEVTLMDQGYHDVARGYIIYRDKHKQLRNDAPQNLKVYRKDETSPVRFNPIKVASTLENLFRKFEDVESEDLITSINTLTENVIEKARNIHEQQEKIHLHDIQDLIETALMESGYFAIAKQYIIDRVQKGTHTPLPKEKRARKKRSGRIFTYSKEDGTSGTVSESEITELLTYACRNLATVDVKELLDASTLNFYEGIKEKEIDTAHIMAAKAKIELEPDYSKVAMRLLLDSLYRETVGLSSYDPSLKENHAKYFKEYIPHGIAIERLSPQLAEFDLDTIAQALKPERDDNFLYLGLQTLYDRYFIHENERRLETPQIFWMRVAMGLALNEEDKTAKAIEFYDILSEFYYVSSTPTLFNSGTVHSQLSSCFLATVQDDLKNIFKVIADDAQLSKWSGGLGNDWTNVRGTGARIKGTNGKSQGVIPFLKVANDTAVAVNQCFDPYTRIFTSRGVLPIANVNIGDLVLGISGTYRKVTNRFVYNQKDPMISINIKHAIDPIRVTTAHPFYVIQGVPLEQACGRTMSWLAKGKIRAKWIEASQLQIGDYVAQVIPKEVVPVPGFTEEDARLYGILLGDGHLCKNGMQWGVSGNPQRDTHLEFVRNYLRKRGIHFWETGRGETYTQVSWSSGYGVVRDATTGRFVSAGNPTLPFEYDDLYDNEKKKYIAPRFAHLPKPQTLALLQGLIETDGNLSRGKEITFCNTSLHLIEGVRYQCLRFGVPTAGNRRTRKNGHTGCRSDGSQISFLNETVSYDLRIPAFAELAEKVEAQPLIKKNWLQTSGFIWSRVKAVENAEKTMAVCDLLVEDDESYMTTAGLAHNGGKRKGAMCAYLETWHIDIEDFLELRKNTGDERRRTHDMNTANWIPDLFMKRVKENKEWTLFSPDITPDLHDLYGAAFEKRYQEYEKMVEDGTIKLYKKVDAMMLWRKILSMLFETGHPWITFKDPSNIRSPQDHVGVVHSSNLCTEILLNTSETETAVCNLGSVNLAKHVTKDGLDEDRLKKTIKTAIRMLDNVIDINFYPIPDTANANLKHRPVGMGMMGFQDALTMQSISYASHEAVQFADKSMEMISYYAILGSSELAKERGSYETYKGSKWDRGLLPIDTIQLLEKERGCPVEMDTSSTLDWEYVREHIKKYGMRNSNTMAIAPTATIANIVGVTASIEPTYKQLYAKSNLSGEFTVINPHLVTTLKEKGLWDAEMVDDLKYFDGSLTEIDRIPNEIKQLFLTCFEVEPEWIIECGSRRQKWIDMGQSLNLYLAEPSGKKLSDMYMLAWGKGLKTTYYLRTLGATQIEKSTTDINKRGLQPRWMKNASPSSRVTIQRETSTPKIPTYDVDEGCESCQ